MNNDDAVRRAFVEGVQRKRTSNPPVVRQEARSVEPRKEPKTGETGGAREKFMGGVMRRLFPLVDFSTIPTTAWAPWYKKRCRECRHTFREGDPVVCCPGEKCGAVYHQHPIHGLDCFAIVHEQDRRCACGLEIRGDPPPVVRMSGPGEIAAAFVGGLKRVFGEAPDAATLIVDESLQGQVCAVCGHTVRLHEVVVRCACGRGPGGTCGAVVHLDVARRLHCWRDWQLGRGKGHCPLTGLKFQ